jgi:hypothetical protein
LLCGRFEDWSCCLFLHSGLWRVGFCSERNVMLSTDWSLLKQLCFGWCAACVCLLVATLLSNSDEDWF